MTQPATSSRRLAVLDGRDHMLGPATAPVTLLEYGDYECPYTRRAQAVVVGLRRRFGDRLRVVYRHFPLAQVHPHAEHAAEAAEAAAAQGRFWEMHDLLFHNQQALEDDHLQRYAVELGLDLARFNRELAEHTYAERVHEDVVSGLRVSVRGTPTFFINGVRHDGPADLVTLGAAIERAADTDGGAAMATEGEAAPAGREGDAPFVIRRDREIYASDGGWFRSRWHFSFDEY